MLPDATPQVPASLMTLLSARDQGHEPEITAMARPADGRAACRRAARAAGPCHGRFRLRRRRAEGLPAGISTWYATVGHHPDHLQERRRNSPWYTSKAEPSTTDMTVRPGAGGAVPRVDRGPRVLATGAAVGDGFAVLAGQGHAPPRPGVAGCDRDEVAGAVRIEEAKPRCLGGRIRPAGLPTIIYQGILEPQPSHAAQWLPSAATALPRWAPGAEVVFGEEAGLAFGGKETVVGVGPAPVQVRKVEQAHQFEVSSAARLPRHCCRQPLGPTATQIDSALSQLAPTLLETSPSAPSYTYSRDARNRLKCRAGGTRTRDLVHPKHAR
jgi:hypothetical protein